MAAGVRSRLNRGNAPYIALVFVALVIRLWELGARTMHYDECVHINCARGFFTNPLPWCLQGWTHGPFQFEGTAFFSWDILVTGLILAMILWARFSKNDVIHYVSSITSLTLLSLFVFMNTYLLA